MTSLEAALRKIGTELTQAGVPFALVGGLAVSVRTEPRFTRDADLVVALAGDAEAEALIHNLRVHGYGIEAVVEQEAVGRLATVRLTPSREPQAPVVDLLPQLRIAVARTGHLIALKVLSRDDVKRPQDIADLRALLRVASPAELERARKSLALISTRGYHRGRDLALEIDRLLPSQ